MEKPQFKAKYAKNITIQKKLPKINTMFPKKLFLAHLLQPKSN